MNRLVHLWSLTLGLLTGVAYGEVVEVTDTVSNSPSRNAPLGGLSWLAY